MNIAVIFAGGSGTRMKNADIPKQFLLVHGKPIIVHTIEIFQKHKDIDGIVVVCLENWIDYMQDMKQRYGLDKIKRIVPGGQTGQMSIYNGLAAADEIYGHDEDTIVLIHDGVRPLIKQETISDNIEAVKKYGSAITCTAASETVILVDNDFDGNVCCEKVGTVPDRSTSRFAKAPQSFYLKDILKEQKRAIAEGKTDMIDSCTLMKEYGHELHTVIGPDYNIKVTTPKDFVIFMAIYDAIENKQLD